MERERDHLYLAKFVHTNKEFPSNLLFSLHAKKINAFSIDKLVYN